MSIGMPNINQYFKVAMSYPVAKLQAVMRGQDHSIPMVAAMAAYEVKSPMEIAAKAQQAAQKQSTVSIRDKLAREGEEEKNGMLPDDLMMAMQQQQQGSLPENTGIGQLPAPNMETMHAANGGIIAFDDGGYVPGYADAGVVPSMDALFNRPYTPNAKARSAISVGDKPAAEIAADEATQDLANEEALKQTIAKTPEGAEKQRLLQQLTYLQKKTSKTPRPSQPAQPAASDLKSSQDSAFGSNLIISDKPGETVNTGIPQVLPKADAAKRDVVSKAPSSARPSATPVASGIPTVSPADTEQQMADVMSRISGTQDAEIKSQYADLKKQQDAGIAALRKEREVGRPKGKAFEGLETELKEEKDAATGKEAKNLQMALVNAGLAIAGGTSRYALENIGKGALVGTKQYMDGLDKLEAAAKERRKMTAMIDEARRAEARGDWKEKNEFETKAFELDTNFKKTSIDALAKIYDTNKKEAVQIFKTYEEQRHADIRNRETNQTHLATTGMTTAASRENAAATREGNQIYREGTLRQQAQENARKLLDDKMNTFKLEKLTVTPQVYEQWRQFYLDQAFKDAGLNRGGGGGSGVIFSKEDNALIERNRTK